MKSQAARPARVKLSDVKKELAELADEDRAKNLAWFFKTGKGQYGEGDRFLGIRVPMQRAVARRFASLPLQDVAKLLRSPVHEHRFTAAEILVLQYERGFAEAREEVFRFYLDNARRFNNWDLVDTSAPYVVGEHLLTRDRGVLKELAASENLWERRISIVATLRFLKAGETGDTFAVAKLLLKDRHDLIHKAVGWALRESGRVSRAELLAFLRQHYSLLPRTALRYAIEHLPVEQRKRILAGDFN